MASTNMSDEIPENGKSISLYFSIAMLAVFSVIGIFGNSLAVIVFSRKKDKLTSTIFILALAIIDLLTCAVLMPMTMYMEYADMKISSDVLCKFYNFLQTAGIPFSAFMIAAIAVDRYLSICHPFLPVFNEFRAKMIILVLALVSCGLGLVAGMMFATFEESVVYDNTTSTNITFSNCSLSYQYFSEEFVAGYKYAHLSVYLMSVLVVSVLYLLIYCSVINRRRKRMKQRAHIPRTELTLTMANQSVLHDGAEMTQGTVHTSNGSRKSSSPSPHNGRTDDDNNIQNNIQDGNDNETSHKSSLLTNKKQNDKKSPTNSPDNRKGSAANILASIFRRTGSRNSAKERLMIANLKTAAMLFVVSLVFIVVFLPAMLVILEVLKFDPIFFYLYFINNVSNPVIYAFMNRNFRDDLKILLLCQRKGRLVRYR